LIIYFIVILSMPFLRHQFWDAEFAPGFTVTKMFGAACLLYALIHLGRRHGIPMYFATLQAKLMLVFFVMATFSFASMGGKLLSVELVNPIYMYISTLVFFFITVTVVDSMKRMYWSFMVAVGSVAFASLYMLREWQKGTEAYGEGYRPGWVVGDSNYFTIAALAVLPIAFELVLVGRTRMQKAYAFGCMVLTFAAVTLGASRGGFLGIILMVCYLIARSRNLLRNVLLVVIVTVPFLALAPNSPINRFFHPQGGDTESVNKHLTGWGAGLNMVWKNPFTGVGFGNYKAMVTRYDTTGTVRSDPHVAHNAYLEIAAEMGIPAFLVYLSIFVAAFFSAEKTLRKALARGSELMAAMAVGCQASILGMAVGIFFVSGQYTRLLWFILCMTMVMPVLLPARAPAKKELPRAKPPQPQEEENFRIGEALVELH
jgi:O-antigen ligase